MRILVFTEGTLLMHMGALGKTREQIVDQVKKGEEPSLRDWANYIPIGNALAKLKAWRSKGAEIVFLTSRRNTAEVEAIRAVLRKNGFPEGRLLHRQVAQEYRDAAEKAEPDVIVEDNCESIGGADEMTYTHLRPELKRKIRPVAVKEFGGIDHLPDNPEMLLRL